MIIKKKLFLGFILFFFFFSNISFAGGKLIPLKDNLSKNSEYTSLLCFSINYTDQSKVYDKVDFKRDIKLRYFDGLKVAEVPVVVIGHWDKKGEILYRSALVYIAAKPGKYDLLDLFYATSYSSKPGIGGIVGTTMYSYSFPINAVVELKAGKAYYAGEAMMNVDENKRKTYSLFANNLISDSIVLDFAKKYPNTYPTYKNDFVPATFFEPTPLQPAKVVFSSHFAKGEGIWNESSDSLHTASFENGKYCIESKSGYNMGTEIIELPEKWGKSFDMELRCQWKIGVNNSAFGFIIPGRYTGLLSPKCPKGEIEPRGYVFGISSNGFACFCYECMLGFYEGNKNVKKSVNLTDWKNMPNIKINDDGQNTIRLQVIDQVITYYINDKFVSRAPYNSLSQINQGYYMNYQNINEFTEFLNEDFKLLGIFSYNKQKIEFDEMKVSKFK